MIPHIEPLIGKAEQKAMQKYLASGGFLTEYKKTEEFESKLAEFLEVKYVSCVPSGTVALYLALLASGIGKGDEVLVPDLTMVATANAVRMTGAKVVLIDIENSSFCMDIDKIEKDLSSRTKALIYVELNGRSGDLAKIKKFCKANNLVLIEDACQALGSKHKGKYLGTFGRFGCFSLSFHKIITTGQGGFVVSHTKEDYETIEKLKDFGRLKGGSDIHDSMGYNFKFTDLQAVIGLEQLKTIKQRITKKKKIFEWYSGEKTQGEWVPWFIEAEVIGKSVTGLKNFLKKNGIESRLMYPPLHTQKIYKSGDYPVATEYSKNTLWLPSSLNLTRKQVNHIKEVLNAYF